MFMWKIIDIYGDHNFHCVRHSKTRLHNLYRDCIALITSSLWPYTNFIINSTCCDTKEMELPPVFPTLRPGDVVLQSSTNPLAKYFRETHPITAIDCTIIGKLTQNQLTPPTFSEAKSNLLKLHWKNEAMKYNRGSQKNNDNITFSGESIVKEINIQNVTYWPLYLTPLDQWGPLQITTSMKLHLHKVYRIVKISHTLYK